MEGWADGTLVVWQGLLPTGEVGERLRSFAAEGGVVLFLPPGMPDTNRFQGTGWGAVEAASEERAFRVQRYDEEQGPLARSEEGISLPLVRATFLRRQGVVSRGGVLAAFDDGLPLLVREAVGRGEAYFLSTWPRREWSSLGDGEVLVPLVQRLLELGGRRLQRVAMADCGALSETEAGLRWETLGEGGAKDPRWQAGVARAGERVLAGQRPVREAAAARWPAAAAGALLGGLPVLTLQERRTRSDALQGEVWRMFLVGMLLFLMAEGWLILPARRRVVGEEGGLMGRGLR